MHYTPYIPPEDLNRQGRRFLSWAWEELPHFVVSGMITVLTKNPLYGAAFHAGLHAPGIDLIRGVESDSGGLGAPAGPTPTAPSTSLQGTRRSPESTECLARVRSEETVLGVSHAPKGITGHSNRRSV